MDAKNLAIVFAPNLLQAPSSTSPLVEAQQMKDCISVVEHLIMFFDRFPVPYDFDYSRVVHDHGVGVGPLLDNVGFESTSSSFSGESAGQDATDGSQETIINEIML